MQELPDGLRTAGFSVSQGLELGLTSGQMRNRGLTSPFHGVRTADEPKTQRERASAFAPLLRPWQALAGVSALAMLGLPVPWRLRKSQRIEIVSAIGRGHPARSGVCTRRIPAERMVTWDIEGARVAAAPLVWALLAVRCTVPELVMIGDAIISEADNYPDRRFAGPISKLEHLEHVARAWAGRTGAGALREALSRIRPDVESPRETDMRLFIVDAGMPEPEVQITIRDPQTGRRLGRADLLHRRAGVVEEYEGEGHRSKQQWDRDIQKYRDFERVGLHVVRATNRDFVPNPDRWLADLAAVLRRRGGECAA